MDKAHIRIFQARILAFDTLGDDLSVCQQSVKGFRRIVVHGISTPPEGTSQCDCRHSKVTSHNFRHTFIHKLYFCITRIVTKCRQINLQSCNRFKICPYIQVLCTGHDSCIYVSFSIRNQPTFFIRLIYIAATHITERKTDTRRKTK